MIRRPPRSTQSRSSAASDVYKRQGFTLGYNGVNIKEEKLSTKKISLYPNPTSGKIEAVLEDVTDKIGVLTFFDVRGKFIKQLNIFSYKAIVDLGDLPKGVYFIQNDTHNFNQKIIKY